jgi:enamine deaminase RidA (YjgF/YER057c/UK114 family)
MSLLSEPVSGGIMKIERFETNTRLSKAVIYGDTVYLAGIVDDAPAGKAVAEQTAAILEQIDGLLAKAGTSKNNLLSANIWLRDMADFAEMNKVWETWLPQDSAPARATVQAHLATPDRTVEIMVTAAK